MVKMIKWFKKFNIVGQVILVTLLSPVLILASFSLGLFTVCMSLYELSKKKVYRANFETSEEELEYIKHDIETTIKTLKVFKTKDIMKQIEGARDIKHKAKLVDFESCYPKIMMSDSIEYESKTLPYLTDIMKENILKDSIKYHPSKRLLYNAITDKNGVKFEAVPLDKGYTIFNPKLSKSIVERSQKRLIKRSEELGFTSGIYISDRKVSDNKNRGDL